jgi:hypothetical protein
MTQEEKRKSSREASKKYRSAHPDRIRASNKKAYEANREDNVKRAAAWCKNNRERRNARERKRYAGDKKRRSTKEKAYRDANIEQYKARYKAWRVANRDRLNAKSNARQKANRKSATDRQKAWRKANSERLKLLALDPVRKLTKSIRRSVYMVLKNHERLCASSLGGPVLGFILRCVFSHQLTITKGF